MSLRLFLEQLGQMSRGLSRKIDPEGELHCGTSWVPGKAEMKGMMLMWTPTAQTTKPPLPRLKKYLLSFTCVLPETRLHLPDQNG